MHDDNYMVGWFGVPGEPCLSSTPTHLVANGKPVCGAEIINGTEFQCRSRGVSPYGCDCRTCEKKRLKIVKKLYELS
jgi:hypothetical protein